MYTYFTMNEIHIKEIKFLLLPFVTCRIWLAGAFICRLDRFTVNKSEVGQEGLNKSMNNNEYRYIPTYYKIDYIQRSYLYLYRQLFW